MTSLDPRLVDEPGAIEYALVLADVMIPLMTKHRSALESLVWPVGGGDHLQAFTDMSPLGGDASKAAFRRLAAHFGVNKNDDRTDPTWNVVDAAMDYVTSVLLNHYYPDEVDRDQDLLMRSPWLSVVPESVFMSRGPVTEYDEGGLPVHLSMGITADGRGPVNEWEDGYVRTVCWCHIPYCTRHMVAP